MGTFDKFKSSGKLFRDSSGLIIDKLPDPYTYTCMSNEYVRVLRQYFFKYSIDMFDDENISKLFDFYPLDYDFKTGVYDDLKEIQKNSTDYVTDYCSYKDRLKAYYDIHGEDTEWLVKIFAERYDLDRFNITPEDVLDDLHNIMTTAPQISNPHKNRNTNTIAWKLGIGFLTSVVVDDYLETFAVEKIYIENNTAYLFDSESENLAIKINIDNMDCSIVDFDSNNYRSYKQIDSIHDSIRESFANTLNNLAMAEFGTGRAGFYTICNHINCLLNEYLQRYGISTQLSESSWKIYYNGARISLAEVIEIIPKNAKF